MSLETPMPTDRRAELLQLFFISATGVEHIEKKYVDGSFCGGKGEVGEDSGRHRRHCGKLVGDRASDVLFEVLNPLRDVLLQQGEVRGFEVVDGVLMLVGDDNELGCRMQRRDVGLDRLLCGNGGICRFGGLSGADCGKKRRQ